MPAHSTGPSSCTPGFAPSPLASSPRHALGPIAVSAPPPCDLRVELLEDRSLPSTTLMLSLTAPATIAPGGAIDYVLTLSNTGSADAVNVRLGDLTTLGTTYVTQSQTAGPAFTLSESGGSVLDTISTLPAGSTASFSLVVLVSSSTSNGTWLSDSASVQTDTTLTGSSVTSASGSTTVYDFGTVSVTNPGPQSSTEGSSVSLTISASDSSSGTLTYAASNLPPGLAISPSTGAIAGTVALGAAADSPYSTTVTAGDGTFSAWQTFTWDVSSPVSLTNPGTQSSAEGATVSLTLSASDSSGGTLSYSAIGLPPGLKINTGSGAITGTVGAGAAAGEPYSVTASAADGTYSAQQTFTWNVTSPVGHPGLAGSAPPVGYPVLAPARPALRPQEGRPPAGQGLPLGIPHQAGVGRGIGGVAGPLAAPRRQGAVAGDRRRLRQAAVAQAGPGAGGGGLQPAAQGGDGLGEGRAVVLDGASLDCAPGVDEKSLAQYLSLVLPAT